MKIIKEEIVAFSEAKKMLESKVRVKGKELGYEQNNSLEYLRKFSKLSDKKTKELINGLGKVEKLKDRHKVMISNFLPEDMDDMRILFAHEIISISEEDKKKILAIVKKFA